MLVIFECVEDRKPIAINPRLVEFVVPISQPPEGVDASLIVMSSGERWSVIGAFPLVTQSLNGGAQDDGDR